MKPAIKAPLSLWSFPPVNSFSCATLSLFLTSCSVTKPHQAMSLVSNTTTEGYEKPLPDLVSCYLRNSDELKNYYEKGTRPSPIVRLEKTEGITYKVSVDLSEKVITENVLAKDDFLRRIIVNLREGLKNGIWSRELKADLNNGGRSMNETLAFKSSFNQSTENSPEFSIDGVLSWGLLDASGYFRLSEKAPSRLYSMNSMVCVTFSREIPRIFSRVYLNGDQSFSMIVEGMITGKAANCQEGPPNYLVVTQMTPNIVEFMKTRTRGNGGDNYVPVTNAAGEIVGWLTQVAADQDALLKGLIETIHSTKFRDPLQRALDGHRSQDPYLYRGLFDKDPSKGWTPDLSSANYQDQINSCPLIVKAISHVKKFGLQFSKDQCAAKDDSNASILTPI